jgi:plastocyanin
VWVVRRPTTFILGSALVAAVVLSGCGDTDEPAPEASGDCKTVTVEIPEFAFEPDPIEIAACDSVVWTNAHDQAHTSTGNADQAWSTGNIAAGESSDPVPFEQAGSFAYICALHPFMTGTVEVA